ncbi:hypothetical protein N8I77_005287 [Diaporthe amygdali]|uniref:Histone chaperone RTT106/FACT complex subunit SPT16-like middle domain-containing protein n=1 Tax=Phomopsis amygdali TaxID=1214568 RepID=A0AAD9SER4_PHOAM|nr:hypothetical protein N8I77_005287 [Diaporthe amygdali]
MAALDNEKLGLVFGARPDILEGIKQAADTPERITLFNSIASFVSDQQAHDPSGEPSAKRRRVEGNDGAVGENGTISEHGMLPPPTQAAVTGTQQTPAAGAGAGSLLIDMANAAAKEVILLEVKEISVAIPQRKKYDLCFTKNYLYTKQVGTTTPVQGMVYDWSQIEFVFYTPIPEKQQLHFNYILFPRNTALASTKSFPPADFEPLVFSVPTSSPKPGIVGGYAAQTASQVSDSYTSLMHWAINSQLQSVNNTTAAIVGTDPRVFFSAVRQPHRPKERAVYIKAFRGSKDGYLFFLPNGILWGFKKPLLFIPLDRINAVSYVNVLQRTFNMVVEVDVSHAPQQDQSKTGSSGANWEEDEGPKTEEIEFAMIDQEDYSTIDETYVRQHGLNNRSMAEGRKAKRQLRENFKGDSAGADDAASGTNTNGEQLGDNLTQLALAELGDEDEDEEDEEDYDPGSEGESEGEGDSSEEDDEDDDDEEEDDEEADGYDEEGGEEEGYVEDHE